MRSNVSALKLIWEVFALFRITSKRSFIYAILQDASDDVPLLDVAFPNINGKGNDLTLQIYEEGERENKDSISWRKLSIWELTGEAETLKWMKKLNLHFPCHHHPISRVMPSSNQTNPMPHKEKCSSASEAGAMAENREAELIPSLSISDIQYIIPALRAQ